MLSKCYASLRVSCQTLAHTDLISTSGMSNPCISHLCPRFLAMALSWILGFLCVPFLPFPFRHQRYQQIVKKATQQAVQNSARALSVLLGGVKLDWSTLNLSCNAYSFGKIKRLAWNSVGRKKSQSIIENNTAGLSHTSILACTCFFQMYVDWC